MQSQTQLTREAWRSYASMGRLRHDLLRPEVYRAWERCHFDQVSPRQLRPKLLSKQDCERLRSTNTPLIQAAEHYLDALSQAAGGARHAALLSAADGTLIDLRGDDESLNGPDAMPPPGAMLAESVAGSNGIGTALVERKYVEVYGPEHFTAGFHDHLCLGLPLRGAQGEVAGALCLSVRQAPTASQLRGLFFAVARGIESELQAEAMRAQLRQLRDAPSRAAQSMVLLHEEVERTRLNARQRIVRSVEHLAGGTTRFDPGEPSDHLQIARENLEKYLRCSRLWQLGSGLTLAEPMTTAEFAATVVEIMQSEARTLRVRLELAPFFARAPEDAPRHMDAGVGLASPALVRLALAEIDHALRSIGPKGSVVLGVAGDGSLCLFSQAEDASLRIERRLPCRVAA